MREAIRNFSRQFAFEPVVVNRDRLARPARVVVLGMGGSGLAAPLLLIGKAELPITMHRDYGLPSSCTDLRSVQVIANSYSGNTEEVLDGFETALRQGLSIFAISIGGKLIERAKEAGAPYIQMPDTGIQPRMALGLNTLALAAMMGEEEIVQELHALADPPSATGGGGLKPESASRRIEISGKALAEKLNGKIPVIYSSRRNQAIAYTWKIKLNETAKIPAFFNVFPELNHNEMTGFDVADSTRPLSEKFAFLFLKDSEDHPKVQKRMEVTEKLFRDRGFTVKVIPLEGKNVWEKIFSSLILADWTAYFLAGHYGVEAEEVPMVEEFKKMIYTD